MQFKKEKKVLNFKTRITISISSETQNKQGWTNEKVIQQVFSFYKKEEKKKKER